jgi:flagellin
MITTINDSLENVNAALARLGSGSKKFAIQQDFISKLIDTLNTGIGNLVDADLAVESARLQALQVKQQLGVQALSIANQQPQIILSLFR